MIHISKRLTQKGSQIEKKIWQIRGQKNARQVVLYR